MAPGGGHEARGAGVPKTEAEEEVEAGALVDPTGLADEEPDQDRLV
jgi:hypothetical protein